MRRSATALCKCPATIGAAFNSDGTATFSIFDSPARTLFIRSIHSENDRRVAEALDDVPRILKLSIVEEGGSLCGLAMVELRGEDAREAYAIGSFFLTAAERDLSGGGLDEEAVLLLERLTGLPCESALARHVDHLLRTLSGRQ